MTVAAVMLVRNEADVLETTIRHLFSQGVDFIVAADHGSTDGTRDIFASYSFNAVRWHANDDPDYRQVEWMNRLAAEASLHHADWIVPCDADEFWISRTGGTVAELLDGSSLQWASAELFHHRSWDDKYVTPERLPKVAYRWTPQTRLAAGNHSVDGVEGYPLLGLEIRHLQYRSAEHFIAKVRDHNSTLTLEMRERGEGAHKSQYEGLSPTALRKVYEQMCAEPVIYDPIPCSR